MNPYPHKFDVKMTISEYIEQYQSLSDGEHLKDVEVKLAGIFLFNYLFLSRDEKNSVSSGSGNSRVELFLILIHVSLLSYIVCASVPHLILIGRVMNKRSSSLKLFFYDLYGGGVKVQVMADARY